MDEGKRRHAPKKREITGLTSYCSRLAGENICQCGSNLKGRYCLWSYYPVPQSWEFVRKWRMIDENTDKNY